MIALARRAEWHCMLTATGFMVICVAASSTCTANAVESPPSPCGPTPRRLTAVDNSSSRLAPAGSAQCVPSGRIAARLARCTHKSAVPPTPTPTIVGVGVGGTADLCAHLAERAATRPLRTHCVDPAGAALEDEFRSGERRDGTVKRSTA